MAVRTVLLCPDKPVRDERRQLLQCLRGPRLDHCWIRVTRVIERVHVPLGDHERERVPNRCDLCSIRIGHVHRPMSNMAHAEARRVRRTADVLVPGDDIRLRRGVPNEVPDIRRILLKVHRTDELVAWMSRLQARHHRVPSVRVRNIIDPGQILFIAEFHVYGG